MLTDVLVLLVLVIVGILVGVYFTREHYFPKLQDLKRNIKWYSEKYLTRSGWHDGFGNFNLLSLDGGKTWHNCVTTAKKEVIIEPANPRLVKQLDGMDELIKYTETHGPIGSKPITEKQIKLLRNAGFSVRKR